jgi:uncharacterized membrane protein
MTAATTTTLLLALCVPALALWLVARHAWARRLGTIVLCYAAGLLVGNADLLPHDTLPVRTRLAETSIALALPMILFTMDVRAWARTAPRALSSLALAAVSVAMVAAALFLVVSRGTDLPRVHELAGLAVGVYTGGTPNLAAIKIALGVDDARYLLFNAVDTAVSMLYLMFMVTLGKVVFGRLLAPSSATATGTGDATPVPTGNTHDEDYRPLLRRRGLLNAAMSLLLAVAVVACALGLATVMSGGESPALLIALVATLGIVASLVPRVRRLAESYQAGMYLIYVFSFTVASMASLGLLAGADLVLPAFIAATICGSVVLHALLCRLARIDVDTFLVTSVSAICSPAFVPLVARSLGNPAVLLSGITTGIIGYAIGTYLGIGLALLLARCG